MQTACRTSCLHKCSATYLEIHTSVCVSSHLRSLTAPRAAGSSGGWMDRGSSRRPPDPAYCFHLWRYDGEYVFGRKSLRPENFEVENISHRKNVRPKILQIFERNKRHSKNGSPEKRFHRKMFWSKKSSTDNIFERKLFPQKKSFGRNSFRPNISSVQKKCWSKNF